MALDRLPSGGRTANGKDWSSGNGRDKDSPSLADYIGQSGQEYLPVFVFFIDRLAPVTAGRNVVSVSGNSMRKRTGQLESIIQELSRI
jgi:hypothetical protein